jgi:general secretion pathway protein L
MSLLRIYFSSHWRDSTSLCPWALCDDSGAVLQTGNDTLAALPKCRECVAIAAPDRVLCVSARMPPGSRRRWQAALPFVAEEHTLPDPEENHVVPGSTQADGRMRLAITDKAWLKRIIAACRTANLNLRRMVAESFLPAPEEGTWALVWDGSSGFLSMGADCGLALDNGDAQTAPLALRLSLNACPVPVKILLLYPPQVPVAQRILPQWQDLPVELGSVWDWQRAPIPSNALNLLWGELAPSARISEYWPKMRPAFLIMLALLGLEMIGANLEWAMLSHEKKALTQDMEHSFRSAFGESGALVNAPLQMGRKLAELRHNTGLPDDGDFLQLLDAAAPTFAALPAGSVRGMHYESGRLDVDMKLAQGNDYQNVQQRLKNKGLGVQIGEIHVAGGSAEARLTLLAGGVL